jgi:hypothetical protein
VWVVRVVGFFVQKKKVSFPQNWVLHTKKAYCIIMADLTILGNSKEVEL